MPAVIKEAHALGVDDGLLMHDSGDSDAEALISHIISLVSATEAEAQRNGLNRLAEMSLYAVADVRNSRGRTTPLASADWDFLRLFICTCPLMLAVGRGEFGLAFDWIVRSLSDTTDVNNEVDERTLDTDALTRILHSNRGPIRLNRDNAILDWAAAAFYYSRTQNTLVYTLGNTIPAVLDCVCARPPNDQRYADASLQVLAWLDRYQHSSRNTFADIVAGWASRDDMEQRLKASLLMGLSARPEATKGRSPADWAQLALADRSVLVQHEPAHLLSIQLANAPDIDEGLLEELVQASLAADQARRGEIPAVHLASTRARLFPIIQPVFARLISVGRVDDAIRLIAAWRGYAENTVANAAVIAPLYGEQVSIAIEGKLLEGEAEMPKSTLSEVVQATNRALSLQVVRTDVDEVQETVDRIGVPKPSCAEGFEQTVENWLQVERLTELPNAFIPISLARIPLQPLLIKHFGQASPISLSLQPPLLQSPTRSVAIWKTDLALADEETEAVAEAFLSTGASVQVYQGGKRTASLFRRIYEGDEFDVLWVSGHAELDHFRPSLAYLDLGNDQQLHLAEALALDRPTRETQRLIVLNVCDGGAAAIHAGPDEVGFSAALAGPDQAVCSHQWPVHVISAAAFGALFATEIGSATSYIDAYVRAVTAMRGGVEEIDRRLRDTIPDIQLLARLNSNTSVRENWTILDWGSAALYE